MDIQSTEPILSDDMTIGYILKTYPASRVVFERHGVRCKSCKGAVSEPLRNMAANYGIDLKAFLNELREVLS